MRTRSGGIVLLILAFFLAGSVHARGPWRASEGNTSGWQFMTPEERIEHQARIRSFRNYEDCVAYRRQHHQQMAERAWAQGETLRPGRRDVCAHLLPPDAAR